MLDLVKLKTFQLAAATSNFTRTATELGYSQSNVTAHIKALEKELGAPLFDRCASGLVLTDVGRRTLEYARRLLDLADETKAAVSQPSEVGGTIKISAPQFVLAYRLPHILSEFQSLHPEVEVYIQPAPDVHELPYEVINGTVDLAFTLAKPMTSGRLSVGAIAHEELVFAVSPQHKLARRRGDMSLADVAQHKLLLTHSGCAFRSLLERMTQSRHIRLDSKLELGGIDAVKECALLGLGIAVLPCAAIQDQLQTRELVQLPCRPRGFELVTQVLRNAERWPSPGVEALWSIANGTAALKSVNIRPKSLHYLNHEANGSN
jgi:DNA-binding transcriptional LysR family regulator